MVSSGVPRALSATPPSLLEAVTVFRALALDSLVGVERWSDILWNAFQFWLHDIVLMVRQKVLGFSEDTPEARCHSSSRGIRITGDQRGTVGPLAEAVLAGPSL